MTRTMTRKMQATNEMAQAGNMKAAVDIYITKYRNIAQKTFAKMAPDKRAEIVAEAQEFCKGFQWGEKKERPMPVVIEEQAEEAPQAEEQDKPKKERKVSRPMLSVKEMAQMVTDAGLDIGTWNSSDKTINIKLGGKTIARMIVGRDVRFSVKSDDSTSVANATGAEMHTVNRPIPCVFKLTPNQVKLALQALITEPVEAKVEEQVEEQEA